MNRFAIGAIGSAFVLLCSTLHAQVPQLINYQGRVSVHGVNFDGTGQFKFAFVNANGTTAYWTNDGTHLDGTEPTAAVTLTVTKGLYSVLLGDTSLTNMLGVPASVFANTNNIDVRLRVWFNDGTHGFQLLSPDQRIGAAPYAVIAGNVADSVITASKIAPLPRATIATNFNDQYPTIIDSTLVHVALNTVNMITNMTHPSGPQLGVDVGGVYQLTAHFTWGFNATGTRAAYILRNGTVVAGDIRQASTQTIGANNVSALVYASPGDTFEIEVYQNSGSTLSGSSAFSEPQAFLSAVWTSP